jgi:hypothetical protein
MSANDYHNYILGIATGAGWLASGVYLKCFFRPKQSTGRDGSGYKRYIGGLFPARYECGGKLILVSTAVLLILFAVFLSTEPSGFYLSPHGTWITPVALFFTWVLWTRWISKLVSISHAMKRDAQIQEELSKLKTSSNWAFVCLQCTAWVLVFATAYTAKNDKTLPFMAALSFACFLLFLVMLVLQQRATDRNKHIGSPIQSPANTQAASDTYNSKNNKEHVSLYPIGHFTTGRSVFIQ